MILPLPQGMESFDPSRAWFEVGQELGPEEGQGGFAVVPHVPY